MYPSVYRRVRVCVQYSCCSLYSTLSLCCDAVGWTRCALQRCLQHGIYETFYATRGSLSEKRMSRSFIGTVGTRRMLNPLPTTGKAPPVVTELGSLAGLSLSANRMEREGEDDLDPSADVGAATLPRSRSGDLEVRRKSIWRIARTRELARGGGAGRPEGRVGRT